MTDTLTEIVTADIGGTHARFALAQIANGRVTHLGPETVIRAADHASLQTAWEAFARASDRPLPRAAGIAVATPVSGDVLKMTNNPWIIRPALIPEKLGLDSFNLVNDFEAIAHAVAQLNRTDPGPHFRHLCGPEAPLPTTGVITIIGPGTGMGVAQLHCTPTGYHVIATEGGHIDFAPLDGIEDAILARLRDRYRRVSIERVVAGPGLAEIHATLARLEGKAVLETDDKALWALAMSGDDSLAAAALDRFCLALGSVAGDLALAQGASATVIAGGLGYRIRDHLVRSGFAERYTAKGRFAGMMAGLPVKLIVHPQPGLLGAAAAFAQAFG